MTTVTIAFRRDAADQTLHEKLNDALTPGYAAEFDPDEAQRAGAFVEDALSEADAADSALDLEGALTPRDNAAAGARVFILESLPENAVARPAGNRGE